MVFPVLDLIRGSVGVFTTRKSRRTHSWQDIIVRAQAQEQEQRDKPHAHGEKRSNIHKRRSCLSAHGLPKPPRRAVVPFRLLSLFRKVKEPEEMIGDDHAARAEETGRGERDKGPCRGKVLQVDEVCGDGEEDEEEW